VAKKETAAKNVTPAKNATTLKKETPAKNATALKKVSAPPKEPATKREKSPKKETGAILTLDGREVRISNPDKPYFSLDVKLSKLDVVRYYMSVAGGAITGIRDRPSMLKRFVDGAEKPPFYQKRAPENRPEWLRTVTLSFPSGRTAEEVVVDDAAGLAWIVNLGCIELHPHAVRTNDLDHPDELRIDLDPIPGVEWDDVRRVAMEVKRLLEEMGLRGWPKTSGSRGMHVNVRIQQRWTFTEVRRAALALSREIERRAPTLATSKWWKEERHGVFLDYNQNAKDRTTCSAYSIRPLPDARVSAPLSWEEIPDCEPADFTVLTMPTRFQRIGDPNAAMDEAVGSLEKLLELADRDEAAGLGDAPWPPHFRKTESEPTRVAPSRAKGANAARAKPAKGAKVANGSTVATAAKRKATMPLITVANSPSKEAALAGLERWKSKHADAASHLAVDDVLVDSMRGRSSTWTRIRVNLRNVPEKMRPAQETPDPDDDPTRVWREARGKNA
jgi:DNA ligase D-like protein (predicted polymerase)